MINNKKKTGKAGMAARGLFFVLFVLAVSAAAIFMFQEKKEEEMKAALRKEIRSLYGENRKIDDGSYDRDLAVTCRNGTFVGKETEQVRSYKGIPYARPPVGDLRWKMPVPAEAEDGIYEAFYYGKSGIQTEAESERASFYPQGEDCLTLNI